jgi:Rps23 Pro-64 3,4-dihydroxylase Tpa1-like proline 4-hydroxylase
MKKHYLSQELISRNLVKSIQHDIKTSKLKTRELPSLNEDVETFTSKILEDINKNHDKILKLFKQNPISNDMDIFDIYKVNDLEIIHFSYDTEVKEDRVKIKPTKYYDRNQAKEISPKIRVNFLDMEC